MKLMTKVMALSIAGALSLGVAIAPAASADTYPPSIPANGASNPPNVAETPQRVATNIVVVSRATALAATPRYYVFRASTNLKDAPQADRRTKNGKFVPIYKVGQVVRLVARVPANQTFNMAIRDGKKWSSVGTGLSDATGRLSMVAFRGAKAQEYAYRFTSTTDGKTYFVKVNLRGERQREGAPLESLRSN
jgi:hypothetical protein